MQAPVETQEPVEMQELVETQEPEFHPRTGLAHEKRIEYKLNFDNIRYIDKKMMIGIQIYVKKGDKIMKFSNENVKSIIFNFAKEELSVEVFDGFSMIISKSIIRDISITTFLDFDSCRRRCHPFDIISYFGAKNITIAENGEFKSLCVIVNYDDEIEHGGVIVHCKDLDDNINICSDKNLKIGERWLKINNIRKIYAIEENNYIIVEFINYGITCEHTSTSKHVHVNKTSCTERGFLYTYQK
jgi:hypothetical protein